MSKQHDSPTAIICVFGAWLVLREDGSMNMTRSNHPLVSERSLSRSALTVPRVLLQPP